MASLALAFDILARDKGAVKTFDQVGRAAKGAGKDATGFGTAMKSAVGFAAGALAAAGIGNLISDALGEARESQKVGKITAQIIKATGSAAKVTATQVGDLAEAISNKTGVDDEAVQVGANLLLTFKNVRNEAGAGAKIFDLATQAAVDLSKAGFGSIESASVMLGKALNDPLKGMTALGKAGVTFTAAQKEQIKGFVAHGQVLAAQKVILGEVAAQVGGVAAASASMDEKFGVAVGNMKEKIGTLLLPYVEKIQTWLMTKVIPAIQSFVGEFEKGAGPGGDFRKMLEGIWSNLVTCATWLKENWDWVSKLGAALVVTAAAAKVMAAAQAILNVTMAANPIGAVILVVAGLSAALIYAFNKSETFRMVVVSAMVGVQKAVQAMWGVVKQVLTFLVDKFLTVAGAIVNAAAWAFGWVPLLGPKLKEAAGKFDVFAANVRKSMSDELMPDASINVSVNYVTKTNKPSTSKNPSLMYRDGYGLGGGPGTGDGLGFDVRPRFPSTSGMSATLRTGLLSQSAASRSTLMSLYEDYQATGGAAGVGASGAQGWKAMWAAVKAALPGATLNSAFRPNAITATGNRSYHGMGRAIDIGPATMRTFNVVKALFPRATELIFSPAGMAQLWHGKPHMYSGVTRANHWDHVHLAMSRGGLVPGHGRGDRVPAMLEPGEYVVSRPQVQQQGVAAMDALNNGTGRSGTTVIVKGDVYEASMFARVMRDIEAQERAAAFRAGVFA